MLLSLSIWIPIAVGLLVLLAGVGGRSAAGTGVDAAGGTGVDAAGGGERNVPLKRSLALGGAVLGFLVTIPLFTGFDLPNPGMQFVQNIPWFARFNVNYHLGVDGISVLFILLNSFITVLVVIAGWEVIRDKVAQYMAAFLVMSGLLNGTFAALDAVLFYVFFEATLIPMYLVIGVWGGPNRVYAAVKFFLYTLLGSLLM